MSALCQKQTSVASLDHLVGAGEQSWCHRETERSRCLEINDQLELRRLLDRKVGGLLALEDAIDIGCGAAEQIGALNSVGDQASAPGELRNRIDYRQVLLRRQGDDHLVRELRKLSGRAIRPPDCWRPATAMARPSSISSRTGETISSNAGS